MQRHVHAWPLALLRRWRHVDIAEPAHAGAAVVAEEGALVERQQPPARRPVGRLQAVVDVIEDLPALHRRLAPAVQVRRLVGGERVVLGIGREQRVAGRHLVVEQDVLRIDAEPLVERAGRLDDRGVDHLVLAAGEDVEARLLQMAQRVDQPGVGGLPRDLQQPRHLGAGLGDQRVHADEVRVLHPRVLGDRRRVGERLDAAIRAARDHAGADEHRRMRQVQLHRHERARRQPGYRALRQVGMQCRECVNAWMHAHSSHPWIASPWSGGALLHRRIDRSVRWPRALVDWILAARVPSLEVDRSRDLRTGTLLPCRPSARPRRPRRPLARTPCASSR